MSDISADLPDDPDAGDGSATPDGVAEPTGGDTVSEGADDTGSTAPTVSDPAGEGAGSGA